MSNSNKSKKKNVEETFSKKKIKKILKKIEEKIKKKYMQDILALKEEYKHEKDRIGVLEEQIKNCLTQSEMTGQIMIFLDSYQKTIEKIISKNKEFLMEQMKQNYQEVKELINTSDKARRLQFSNLLTELRNIIITSNTINHNIIKVFMQSGSATLADAQARINDLYTQNMYLINQYKELQLRLNRNPN